MSKLETPMTRWYWQQVGGTLIEEFCAVRRSKSCEVRRIDRVIIKGAEFRIAQQSEVSVESKDIIVVQAKFNRLGMYLMGQAFFSAQLMQRFTHTQSSQLRWLPKTMMCCGPLFEQYPGMHVVVYPHEKA
jgi:hypothetical protein